MTIFLIQNTVLGMVLWMNDKKFYVDFVSCILSHTSEVAANRTTKSKQGLIVVRNRHDKLWDLYTSFSASSQISFSTFLKYLPKWIKPPHRQTDVCGYCIRWKLIQASLKRFSAKVNQCCKISESMFACF
jgi:hypothetical protein